MKTTRRSTGWARRARCRPMVQLTRMLVPSEVWMIRGAEFPVGIRSRFRLPRTCHLFRSASMYSAMPDLTPTYTQTWNLSVQREIVKGTLLSVSYIGSQIIHLQAASATQYGALCSWRRRCQRQLLSEWPGHPLQGCSGQRLLHCRQYAGSPRAELPEPRVRERNRKNGYCRQRWHAELQRDAYFSATPSQPGNQP